MDSTPTYNQAVAELEKILEQLRRSDCDVEALTALTRRAAELLDYCRAKLTATESEIETTLAALEQSAEPSKCE